MASAAEFLAAVHCCNKSENENIPSSPASFLLIHNFCTNIKRSGGWGRSMGAPGSPSQAHAGPSTRVAPFTVVRGDHDRRLSRAAKRANGAPRAGRAGGLL